MQSTTTVAPTARCGTSRFQGRKRSFGHGERLPAAAFKALGSKLERRAHFAEYIGYPSRLYRHHHSFASCRGRQLRLRDQQRGWPRRPGPAGAERSHPLHHLPPAGTRRHDYLPTGAMNRLGARRRYYPSRRRAGSCTKKTAGTGRPSRPFWTSFFAGGRIQHHKEGSCRIRRSTAT